MTPVPRRAAEVVRRTERVHPTSPVSPVFRGPVSSVPARTAWSGSYWTSTAAWCSGSSAHPYAYWEPTCPVSWGYDGGYYGGYYTESQSPCA